jgi:hypothetical protein
VASRSSPLHTFKSVKGGLRPVPKISAARFTIVTSASLRPAISSSLKRNENSLSSV